MDYYHRSASCACDNCHMLSVHVYEVTFLSHRIDATIPVRPHGNSSSAESSHLIFERFGSNVGRKKVSLWYLIKEI
jgi:hypothetical protein